MPRDPIQDVARLVTEVVRAHGAAALMKHIPNDVIWDLQAEMPETEMHVTES